MITSVEDVSKSLRDFKTFGTADSITVRLALRSGIVLCYQAVREDITSSLRAGGEISLLRTST